jgi:hypothetical protein
MRWIQAGGTVRTATGNLPVGTPPGGSNRGMVAWARHIQLRTYLLRTHPIHHEAQALTCFLRTLLIFSMCIVQSFCTYGSVTGVQLPVDRLSFPF